METDIYLLCTNARKYNEESSQIYIDSQELERGFVAVRTALEAKMAEADTGTQGLNSDDEDSNSGNHHFSQSSSSSLHVVEVEGYLSDNSDSK